MFDNKNEGDDLFLGDVGSLSRIYEESELYGSGSNVRSATDNSSSFWEPKKMSAFRNAAAAARTNVDASKSLSQVRFDDEPTFHICVPRGSPATEAIAVGANIWARNDEAKLYDDGEIVLPDVRCAAGSGDHQPHCEQSGRHRRKPLTSSSGFDGEGFDRRHHPDCAGGGDSPRRRLLPSPSHGDTRRTATVAVATATVSVSDVADLPWRKSTNSCSIYDFDDASHAGEHCHQSRASPVQPQYRELHSSDEPADNLGVEKASSGVPPFEAKESHRDDEKISKQLVARAPNGAADELLDENYPSVSPYATACPFKHKPMKLSLEYRGERSRNGSLSAFKRRNFNDEEMATVTVPHTPGRQQPDDDIIVLEAASGCNAAHEHGGAAVASQSKACRNRFSSADERIVSTPSLQAPNRAVESSQEAGSFAALSNQPPPLAQRQIPVLNRSELGSGGIPIGCNTAVTGANSSTSDRNQVVSSAASDTTSPFMVPRLQQPINSQMAPPPSVPDAAFCMPPIPQPGLPAFISLFNSGGNCGYTAYGAGARIASNAISGDFFANCPPPTAMPYSNFQNSVQQRRNWMPTNVAPSTLLGPFCASSADTPPLRAGALVSTYSNNDAVKDEIRQQNKNLTDERDQYCQKFNLLNEELNKLKNQKKDLIEGKKSHQQETFLKENDRLQMEIQNKIKAVRNVIDMLSKIIKVDDSVKTKSVPNDALARNDSDRGEVKEAASQSSVKERRSRRSRSKSIGRSRHRRSRSRSTSASRIHSRHKSRSRIERSSSGSPRRSRRRSRSRSRDRSRRGGCSGRHRSRDRSRDRNRERDRSRERRDHRNQRKEDRLVTTTIVSTTPAVAAAKIATSSPTPPPPAVPATIASTSTNVVSGTAVAAAEIADVKMAVREVRSAPSLVDVSSPEAKGAEESPPPSSSSRYYSEKFRPFSDSDNAAAAEIEKCGVIDELPCKRVNYVHYDPEIHWCDICNVFPVTAKEYLLHLHDIEHKNELLRRDVIEYPWHDTQPELKKITHPDWPSERVPIRGLPFFVSASAWYCKLCQQWMGDLHCASAHLKSDLHEQKFQEYIAANADWEEKWLRSRAEAREEYVRKMRSLDADTRVMAACTALSLPSFDASAKLKLPAKKRKARTSSGSSSSSRNNSSCSSSSSSSSSSSGSSSSSSSGSSGGDGSSSSSSSSGGGNSSSRSGSSNNSSSSSISSSDSDGSTSSGNGNSRTKKYDSKLKSTKKLKKSKKRKEGKSMEEEKQVANVTAVVAEATAAASTSMSASTVWSPMPPLPSNAVGSQPSDQPRCEAATERTGRDKSAEQWADVARATRDEKESIDLRNKSKKKECDVRTGGNNYGASSCKRHRSSESKRCQVASPSTSTRPVGVDDASSTSRARAATSRFDDPTPRKILDKPLVIARGKFPFIGKMPSKSTKKGGEMEGVKKVDSTKEVVAAATSETTETTATSAMSVTTTVPAVVASAVPALADTTGARPVLSIAEAAASSGCPSKSSPDNLSSMIRKQLAEMESGVEQDSCNTVVDMDINDDDDDEDDNDSEDGGGAGRDDVHGDGVAAVDDNASRRKDFEETLKILYPDESKKVEDIPLPVPAAPLETAAHPMTPVVVQQMVVGGGQPPLNNVARDLVASFIESTLIEKLKTKLSDFEVAGPGRRAQIAAQLASSVQRALLARSGGGAGTALGTGIDLDGSAVLPNAANVVAGVGGALTAANAVGASDIGVGRAYDVIAEPPSAAVAVAATPLVGRPPLAVRGRGVHPFDGGLSSRRCEYVCLGPAPKKKKKNPISQKKRRHLRKMREKLEEQQRLLLRAKIEATRNDSDVGTPQPPTEIATKTSAVRPVPQIDSDLTLLGIDEADSAALSF